MMKPSKTTVAGILAILLIGLAVFWKTRPPMAGDLVRVEGQSGLWRVVEYQPDTGLYLIVQQGRADWPHDGVEPREILEIVGSETYPRGEEPLKTRWVWFWE